LLFFQTNKCWHSKFFWLEKILDEISFSAVVVSFLHSYLHSWKKVFHFIFAKEMLFSISVQKNNSNQSGHSLNWGWIAKNSFGFFARLYQIMKLLQEKNSHFLIVLSRVIKAWRIYFLLDPWALTLNLKKISFIMMIIHTFV